jgi:hypothetical protein
MGDQVPLLKELRAALCDLIKAEEDSMRLCIARGAMPVSSTRAKATTAEARWARAAEDRDRKLRRVSELVSQLAL